MQLYLNITRTLIQIAPFKSKVGASGASCNISHANTARQDSAGDDCPLCQEVHYNKRGEIKNSFFYCPKFQEMRISDRIRACSRNYYCKRCLFYKNEKNHPSGACFYSNKTNAKCTSSFLTIRYKIRLRTRVNWRWTFETRQTVPFGSQAYNRECLMY